MQEQPIPVRYSFRRQFLCQPLRFIVAADQIGDVLQAPALLGGQTGAAVPADKACDSNAFRAFIANMEAKAVIPANRTRKIATPHDTTAWRQRNRIERCFGKLKHFRRLPARYDRRTLHFIGFVPLAAAMIWMQ